MWGPLRFHIYFRVDFAISANNFEILVRIPLNLLIPLDNTVIFTICLLIHGQSMSFHLSVFLHLLSAVFHSF